MQVNTSEIQSSGLDAIGFSEATNCNRDWEGGLTPLGAGSSAPILKRLHPRRLTRILLLMFMLAGLSAGATSTASQSAAKLTMPSQPLPTFNLQLSIFNLHCASFNLQLAACNHRLTTFNVQLSTFNQHGMGFDQDKATHHFGLTLRGGTIEVEANDASDTTSRDQIRAHLSHIAVAFRAGDFSIPMFVHSETPPGVETMKQLKDAINYKYQETDRGGRVSISTTNPQAIEAIHSFLRYQMREHKTGDPLEPPTL